MAKSEDDEFFHITCHLDPSTKAKIEKGEFVDLEKLLPKDRYHKVNQDCAMTLVNRNGLTYFVPADSGSKITNVRRWEQAFRVYAAVYSNANPNRSAEIWQYVYVINTAASSFAWENVAYYDFTFRQLMHSYPTRNWGKMYLQPWNLAMKDPISAKAVSSTTTSENNGHVKYGDWRDNCCWRYNRGKCNKWNCKFDHRCNYCGGYSHPAVNCYKKKGNKDEPHRKKKHHKKHTSPDKN